MTRAPRIAIVGGGVGGLAAALALQRHGAEIVICEQSPALNEIGAGLNLSPNALSSASRTQSLPADRSRILWSSATGKVAVEESCLDVARSHRLSREGSARSEETPYASQRSCIATVHSITSSVRARSINAPIAMWWAAPLTATR